MDFWRTVVVLVRRWYITIPAFLVTLAVASAAYATVPAQYQSDSILVLTTPLSGGTTDPSMPQSGTITNPLLNFDQSLALTASIVIQQMSSLETAQGLGVTAGSTTTYQVTNGSTNPELLESGPFLFIEGTGPSPAAAEDITQRASAMAATILAQRQEQLQAPRSTHITMQVVAPPTPGRPLTGSPIRKAAAAAALACLLALGTVYGFESIATARRRRRDAAPPEHVAGSPDEAARPVLPPGARLRRVNWPVHPMAGLGSPRRAQIPGAEDR
jgi:hypothetical protein